MPANEKGLYGYIKDMHALDELAEERGTIKNLFFSKVHESPNPRLTTPNVPPRAGKQSLYPVRHSKLESPFGMAGKMSVRPKSILPSQPLKRLTKQEPVLQESGLSALRHKDIRSTLVGLREKATILKNVHEPAADQRVSPEEQDIFKKISLMLESHLSADENLFRSLLNDFQAYFIA